MNKIWKAKYYLQDIIEAQKITIKDLSLESGLSEDFLIDFLKDESEIIVDKDLDKKLCKATNQPIGYFLEKENLYLEYIRKEKN